MKISHQSGCRVPFLLIAAITGTALLPRYVAAHEGERVYPILEITNDMLAQIDLRDGTTDEWPQLLGEPTLKTIDFKIYDDYSTEYDPSDLDFAIWLGWHEELDRIYFAGAFADNAYWQQGHPFVPVQKSADGIALWIDGDHSGPDTERIEEEWRYRPGYQIYAAAARSPEILTTVFIPWVTHTKEDLEVLGDWMIYPPYCEAGGEVSGEQPTIWTIEFFVTPFDLLVPLEPDESVVSDLTAGEVIGLQLWVSDKDNVDHSYQAQYHLESWVDAILLSRHQADSAVGDRTWGRIKAALEMDR